MVGETELYLATSKFVRADIIKHIGKRFAGVEKQGFCLKSVFRYGRNRLPYM